MNATTQLVREFEAVYEEVSEDKGILSLASRFTRLFNAAKRLLTTDVQAFMPKPLLRERPEDDWTSENPSNINRSILDDK
ncbi:MAG: hypothetical protein J7642_01785 [Cyanobacteria bacterium SBC]|nr:hypothetical protein [Cyanobacteria bacterium SBC]